MVEIHPFILEWFARPLAAIVPTDDRIPRIAWVTLVEDREIGHPIRTEPVVFQEPFAERRRQGKAEFGFRLRDGLSRRSDLPRVLLGHRWALRPGEARGAQE